MLFSADRQLKRLFLLEKKTLHAKQMCGIKEEGNVESIDQCKNGLLINLSLKKSYSIWIIANNVKTYALLYIYLQSVLKRALFISIS